MHLLRLAGLQLFPVLLHAGFVDTRLSATCGTDSITGSSGTAICYGPAQGTSQAGGNFFSDGQANVYAASMGQNQDFSTFFSAGSSLQAAYQITFFSAPGSGYVNTGYMEAELSGFADDLGSASASLVTPNGSMNWGDYLRYLILDVPITFGVPLDIQLSLKANVSRVSCCGHAGEDGAAAMFTYRVLDATKNPVPFTVEVVIPEPLTWQLWMAGMCLVFMVGGPTAIRSHFD